MHRKLRLPSPAIVIACIALGAALTGTSVAAVNALAPRNSVANSSIRNNAVPSIKVKARSLLAKDLAIGQIPAGPAGPAGAAGPAGPPGPAGPAGPSGTASLKWALIKADGTILASSGGWSLTAHPSAGSYIFAPGTTVTDKLVLASYSPAQDTTFNRGGIIAGPCGGSPQGFTCASGNDTSHIQIVTLTSVGTAADRSFYVSIFG